MSEVFAVTRSIVFANGCQTSEVVSGYDTKELAENAAAEMSQEFGEIKKAKLVAMTKEGPKALPLTVETVLAQLGVSNIKHGLLSVKVHGSLIVGARGPLIVPGRG